MLQTPTKKEKKDRERCGVRSDGFSKGSGRVSLWKLDMMRKHL